ncbi:MAG: hypothetical protein EZS28_040853, partial [Streblomastix strix]
TDGEEKSKDEDYLTEDDALLLLKTDKTDFDEYYTCGQVDEFLDEKADKTQLIDSYSKSEDDALLLLNADKTQLIDSYSKTEDDALLLPKADKTDFDNFVDLTSAQTESGQKQFSIVTVASVANKKYSSRKKKGFVFATTDEINTWMEDQDNVANLAIGDILYIIDTEVIDYWWDGTSLRMLETELPDISNVVTLFVPQLEMEMQQLIYLLMEILQHQRKIIRYDNNSVFLAGSGVKAIADIYASVNLSNYFEKGEVDSLFETITGQKQFNSNVTAASFTKSGADNTVVLLGIGGTKPLSELGGSVDDSNYVKKTSKSLQVIRRYIRKSMQDADDEPSEEDEDYITKSKVANQYVSLGGNQQIIGTKSFNDSVTAAGFIKQNGTNQQVLLANGSTKPLSEFASGNVDDDDYVKKTGQGTQEIEGNLIRSGSEISFENLQPFQYITKQDAKYGFVQKEGQLV